MFELIEGFTLVRKKTNKISLFLEDISRIFCDLHVTFAYYINCGASTWESHKFLQIIHQITWDPQVNYEVVFTRIPNQRRIVFYSTGY